MYLFSPQSLFQEISAVKNGRCQRVQSDNGITYF